MISVKRFVVVRCPRCGLVQYVLSSQKSRACPRESCRHRFQVSRARVLLQTNDLSAAVEAVKELKLPPQRRRHFRDVE
ncbi:MAG: DUF1922 domain-containing protein [Promethearchaeota archaeon]